MWGKSIKIIRKDNHMVAAQGELRFPAIIIIHSTNEESFVLLQKGVK